MAAMIEIEEWRRPGCDHRCQIRTVIVGNPMRREYQEAHDPDAHEAHGMTLAVGEPQVVVRTGPLAVNLTGKIDTLAGRVLLLTEREWTTLEVLARANGGYRSLPQIARAVWSDGDNEFIGVETNSVRMWVNRLRCKLRGAEDLIGTRVGIGYRLVMKPPTETMPLRPLKRWATEWDCCQKCGTTERPTTAAGFAGIAARAMAGSPGDRPYDHLSIQEPLGRCAAGLHRRLLLDLQA